MTINEYKEKIEKLEFELEQKIKIINDLQEDIKLEKIIEIQNIYQNKK